MRFDSVKLTGLTVMGTHGVLEEEHTEPQPFVIDVEITLDSSMAAVTDDLTKTISYADVAEAVVAVVEGEHVNLIETLAEHIATAVIRLGALDVRVVVHKPRAPIPHTFADVAVEIFRTSALMDDETPRTYVISLGSNQGDSIGYLKKARERIGDSMQVEAVSSIYRTEAQLAEGQDPQPDYYNAVLIATSTYSSPVRVLENLQCIERAEGRERREHWGARTLDLDVIESPGLAANSPYLTLPHPRAHERRFVLEPWAEIDPNAVLDGTPISELLDVVSDQRVERVDGAWGNFKDREPAVRPVMENPEFVASSWANSPEESGVDGGEGTVVSLSDYRKDDE